MTDSPWRKPCCMRAAMHRARTAWLLDRVRQVGLPDWKVRLRKPVRAFVCGPLIAGLLLAAAARTTHAQTLDTVVGERVAAVARQASVAGQPTRRFDLTLADAVQRALDRNLDIAVQRIVPLVQDMRVAAAGAAFLPVASSGFDFNQETTPNRFVFDGGGLRGQPIVSDRGSYDLGVGQQVMWGGGRYDVTWDSTRSESTNIFSTFNPSFGANMSTNFFVLQSQRDLATAQDAELRAILDYQRALIEFDRTQRASLGAAGIAVVGGAMESGAGAIY